MIWRLGLSTFLRHNTASKQTDYEEWLKTKVLQKGQEECPGTDRYQLCGRRRIAQITRVTPDLWLNPDYPFGKMRVQAVCNYFAQDGKIVGYANWLLSPVSSAAFSFNWRVSPVLSLGNRSSSSLQCLHSGS